MATFMNQYDRTQKEEMPERPYLHFKIYWLFFIYYYFKITERVNQ